MIPPDSLKIVIPPDSLKIEISQDSFEELTEVTEPNNIEKESEIAIVQESNSLDSLTISASSGHKKKKNDSES